MDGPGGAPPFVIRDLARSDLAEVVRIDALHTGARKPAHWARVFKDMFSPRGGPLRFGLAARAEKDGGRAGDGPFAGYLMGDVRTFEFGSEECGWVFALGVHPDHARRGVASSLLEEACRRFKATGVDRVRTMVRRNDVPVLSFFRSGAFTGGPFVQLERTLTET